MLKLFIKFIAVIILLIGVILIYDARIITKRFFGFGDQNEASSGLKILGFVLIDDNGNNNYEISEIFVLNNYKNFHIHFLFV